MEVAAPAAMLWHCSSLPAMVPLWAAAMEFLRTWHAIFYGDVIGAGSALAHVQNRKSWGVYWTIAEFGPQAPPASAAEWGEMVLAGEPGTAEASGCELEAPRAIITWA